MGQQQLLLLVLSTIIVGISVVVGMNLFVEGPAQANQDAVIQDIVTIGARAQEWYRKPTELGGGGGSFAGLNGAGGLALLNINASNANADTLFIGATATQVTVNGVGKEDGDDDGTNVTIQAVYDRNGVVTPPTVSNR